MHTIIHYVHAICSWPHLGDTPSLTWGVRLGIGVLTTHVMLCGSRPKFQSMLRWVPALHLLRLGLNSCRPVFVIASVPTAAHVYVMYIYIYIHIYIYICLQAVCLCI